MAPDPLVTVRGTGHGPARFTSAVTSVPGRFGRAALVRVDDARIRVADARVRVGHGARTGARTVSLGTRTLLSPTGLRGAVLEAAWLSAHVATYPLGTLGRREGVERLRYGVGHLPPVQRGLVINDVEAAGTPILLVHGMVDNRSVFTLLRRGLLRRGFGRVVTLNYSPLTGDVRRAARMLAEEVEQLVADTGYERVHVVGHSLGGLIARYYVQRLGGDERVHTLVTLGTPHGGTLPGYLLPTTLTRQLRPGSDLLRELDEPAAGCRTRLIAYWSDLDQMIIPKRNARVVHPDLHVRNVLVRRTGHMSLPIDGRVVHGICTALSHLDHDGSTLAGGATTLTDREESPVTPARTHGLGSAAPPARSHNAATTA